MGSSEAQVQNQSPALHDRKRIQSKSREIDELLAALKECGRTKDLARCRKLHSQASLRGQLSNKYVTNSLISVYAGCRSMANARAVFDDPSAYRDAVSWNALMQGYVDNGSSDSALELFDRMLEKRCAPTTRTYVAALTACVALGGKQHGKLADSEEQNRKWMEKGSEIHYKAVMSSCCDIFVESILVDMYARFGNIQMARNVFDGMNSHNVVSWTALIQGYVDNGACELALELFEGMEKGSSAAACSPNSRTYVVALAACAALGAAENRRSCGGKWFAKGKAIHARAVARLCCDVFVETALINMYAKCRRTDHARCVFEKMVKRDAVSWNCLIQGYVDNGENDLALETIQKMDEAANSATFVAGLEACGNLMAVEIGKTFHEEIRRLGLDEDTLVATRLVDFYAKVGMMGAASEVFDSMAVKDVWAWNTLMSGYSQQGDAERVFELLEKMKKQGKAANEISCTCVLSACSHAGLTERGREFFEAMKAEYGIVPDVKHYTCVVDLLSRGNQLDEALRMVRSMDVEADAVIWSTLLGGCQKWSNVEIGRVAFEALLKLDERDGCGYVLMANIYGSLGMWEKRGEVLEMEKRNVSGGDRSMSLGLTWWSDQLTGKIHKFSSESSCC